MANNCKILYTVLWIYEKRPFLPLKFSTWRISSESKHPADVKGILFFNIPLISSTAEQKSSLAQQDGGLDVLERKPNSLFLGSGWLVRHLQGHENATFDTNRWMLATLPFPTRPQATHRRGLLLRPRHRHSLGEQRHRHVVATHTLYKVLEDRNTRCQLTTDHRVWNWIKHVIITKQKGFFNTQISGVIWLHHM